MVYHVGVTVLVSHVCWKEFSSSKLFTWLMTVWAVAVVYGWVVRSWKLNRMTSVDCAPKVKGEAKGIGEGPPPEPSSNTSRGGLDALALGLDTSPLGLDTSALRLDTSAPVSSISIPLLRTPRART